MADLSSKKSNHISDVVSKVSDVLDTIGKLKSLAVESLTLGYADPTTGLQDSDFQDSTNRFLSASDYRAIITALVQLDAVLSAPNSVGSDSYFKVLLHAKP